MVNIWRQWRPKQLTNPTDVPICKFEGTHLPQSSNQGQRPFHIPWLNMEWHPFSDNESGKVTHESDDKAMEKNRRRGKAMRIRRTIFR